MAWVRVATSSGSMAGNIAMRSWLRPSLRYGSVSTMPLARSARGDGGGVDVVDEVDGAADVAALRRLGHERLRERARLGPAVEQLGRAVAAADGEVEAALVEHPAHAVRRAGTATPSAGVLYVWSRREFSSAIGRLSDGGTQRSVAPRRSMRSIAAGEHSASQRPPSPAKHFCGAK